MRSKYIVYNTIITWQIIHFHNHSAQLVETIIHNCLPFLHWRPTDRSTEFNARVIGIFDASSLLFDRRRRRLQYSFVNNWLCNISQYSSNKFINVCNIFIHHNKINLTISVLSNIFLSVSFLALYLISPLTTAT